MAIIEAEGISKRYPVRRGARALLGRGGLAQWFRGGGGSFDALKDVSLRVEPGESLGIIGRNGSGKSTLLKILAGVTLPTAGVVTVRGRVASLLELGAGFHPMLTGRENVYLNAGLLGMRHAQTEAVFDDIVNFSGIGEFIDKPVDTYSSGMYVRIAFAVAVHVNPDIFLVDEVLAVGDEAFQRKCRKKIGELREQGKTVVFVSHDLGTVNALCDRVVLLSDGAMVQRDTAQKTIDFYLRQIGQAQGVHTMGSGRIEAIFSHGRLSLFKDQHEVTAPGGMTLRIESLGQWHEAAAADWEVVDRRPDGGRARATLPRLPLRVEWTIWLENDQAHFRLTLEVLRPVEIGIAGLYLFVPDAYRQWHYGDLEGPFPDLQPGDLEGTRVVPPEPGCTECAFCAAEDGLPPLRVAVAPRYPYVLLHLDNSDYMTGARVAAVQALVPRSDNPLPPGQFEFGDVTLDLSMDSERFEAWKDGQERRRLLESNGASARMAGGAIELRWQDKLVTHSIHWHTQIRAARLWNLSQALRWGPARRMDHVLEATGESLRFPFKQHWRLTVEDGGFQLEVLLEAFETLTLEEYNVSLGLDAGFDTWHTDSESGGFPPFDPADQEWRHVNMDYGPGSEAEASGPEVPVIRFRINEGPIPFRFTAINTGYAQRTRVLQAIAAPERSGRLTFEPGTHLLADCTVLLSSKEDRS